MCYGCGDQGRQLNGVGSLLSVGVPGSELQVIQLQGKYLYSQKHLMSPAVSSYCKPSWCGKMGHFDSLTFGNFWILPCCKMTQPNSHPTLMPALTIINTPDILRKLHNMAAYFDSWRYRPCQDYFKAYTGLFVMTSLGATVSTWAREEACALVVYPRRKAMTGDKEPTLRLLQTSAFVCKASLLGLVHTPLFWLYHMDK